MDWSENNLCIKCDKGGNVLLCNEKGCPLAVHEGCLGCPARLDDAGRFFCPYCVYKQAVAESRKAREYALARKKALLIFMDGSEKDMGANNTFADNGLNQSKTIGSNVNNALCEDGISKYNNDGIIDRPYPLGEGEKINNAEEDSESSAGSKGEDPSLKMNGENGNRTMEEKQIQEVEHEASLGKENIQEEERKASVEEENIQEEECEASVQKENIQEEECEASVDDENVQEEDREASVEEENIQEEDCGILSASANQDPSLTEHARAKRGSKRSKPVDKESEAVSVQSKLCKQHDKKKQASPTLTPTRRSARRSSSAMGTGKVVKEEFGTPRRLRKPDKRSEKSDTFGSGKRRRLMWTEEEEEALREEAKKYMDEAKIPWKKILEGSDKFDPTRTPVDLKDKWRTVKFV